MKMTSNVTVTIAIDGTQVEQVSAELPSDEVRALCEAIKEVVSQAVEVEVEDDEMKAAADFTGVLGSFATRRRR